MERTPFEYLIEERPYYIVGRRVWFDKQTGKCYIKYKWELKEIDITDSRHIVRV